MCGEAEVRRLFTAPRETLFWGSREPQAALEQGSDTARSEVEGSFEGRVCFRVGREERDPREAAATGARPGEEEGAGAVASGWGRGADSLPE